VNTAGAARERGGLAAARSTMAFEINDSERSVAGAQPKLCSRSMNL